MSNIFKYKEYMTKIEYSAEDQVLYGKIEGINDLINFESEDPKKIEQEFHDAVDDYLSFCEEVGKTPDKAYKGTFNVRISPSLHKRIAQLAIRNGETLNATIAMALEAFVENPVKNCFTCQGNIWKNAPQVSVLKLWESFEERKPGSAKAPYRPTYCRS